MNRTLGLDVGDKRIGLALSDPLGITAQPLAVVERVGLETDVRAVLATVGEPVGLIVAGLPLEMHGAEGRQAARVRRFCDALAARSGIDVVYQDERLTTVQSRRLLESAGVRRGRRKEVLDKMAATLILQAWLDARGGTPRG
jgi:putative Holliday junction resolvase